MTNNSKISVRNILVFIGVFLTLHITGVKNIFAKTKPLDLSIKIKHCPNVVTPGQPLKGEIQLLVHNNSKRYIKDVTVDLILAREPKYPIPASFAVYCTHFQNNVLLKGGRGLFSIPPGSSGIMLKGSSSIPTGIEDGTYYLGAIIDAGNAIKESNEKNNVVFHKVFVMQHTPKIKKPDLIIVSSKAIVAEKFSSRKPVIVFTATIKNIGTEVYKAPHETSMLEISDKKGKWKSEANVPSLGLNETAHVIVSLYSPKHDPGFITKFSPHFFNLRIDPFNKISELDETNNSFGPLKVTIPKNFYAKKRKKKEKLPDLFVKNIIFIKGCYVGATLKNLGPGKIPDSVWDTKSSKDALVAVYLFGEKWGTKPIREIDPRRKLQKPGGVIVYKTGLRIKHKGKIKVQIDPFNSIKEVTKKNNVKKATVFCKHGPDLVVSRIRISPRHPTTNSKIIIRAIIKNIGNEPAKPTRVGILVGKEKRPKLYPVPGLSPGKASSVSRTLYFRRAEKKRVTVIADYENSVKEKNTKNNKAQFVFTVYKGK